MFNYNNWIVILIISVLIISLSFSTTAADTSFNKEDDYFLKAAELKKIMKIKENKLKIIDLRDGVKYLSSHIPTAVHMDKKDFSDINGWVEALIAEPLYFTEIVQKKGINSNSEIVIYADKNSSLAARLWWVFKVYGHQKVKILNKGFDSWVAADFPKEMLATKNKRGDFIIKDVNNNWLINSDTIAENLNNENFVILDTRPKAEYNGDKVSPNAARKGKIPGSLHLEWTEVLDQSYNFKDPEKITEIFQKLGATKDKKTIVILSNLGIKAAHTFLTFKLLGYENVKLYDASWLGWSHRSDLPVKINF